MKKLCLLTLTLSLLLTGCAKTPDWFNDLITPGHESALENTGTQEQEDISSAGVPEAEEAASRQKHQESSGIPEILDTELSQGPAESQNAESEQMTAIAREIVTSSMTEYEKVKAIHDYLVVHVNYDYDNLAAGTLPDTAFTAEGALLLHSAVCEGYAKAFSLLCREAGIEEQLIYGTADDGTGVQTHAWNQVLVDGEWYNIDVTWDDPLLNGQAVTDGSNMIYEYFLVPDTTLSGNHTADPEQTPHVCSSGRFLEENRQMTIQPYLQSPYTFTDSDAEIQNAVEQYLSDHTHTFQLVCDVTSNTPEERSEFVLNTVKDTMMSREEYGQISVETQYGVADYAIIAVNITQ